MAVVSFDFAKNVIYFSNLKLFSNIIDNFKFIHFKFRFEFLRRFMRNRILLVLCAAMFLVSCAWGQEDRGRISGLVSDPSGAVVPNATVTLLNEETYVTQTTVSDGAGAYVFNLLNPGLYSVTVDAPGFSKFEVQHVQIGVAAHVGVNAKLEVGKSTNTVTVSA